MINQGYGKRLVQARRAKGMTQLELCAACGIGALTVSNWENEYRIPQKASFNKAAKALGVSAAWLKLGIDDSDVDISGVALERLLREIERRGFVRG